MYFKIQIFVLKKKDGTLVTCAEWPKSAGRYKSRTGSTRIADLIKNDNNCCMRRSWIGAILIQISEPSWSSPTFVPAPKSEQVYRGNLFSRFH